MEPASRLTQVEAVNFEPRAASLGPIAHAAAAAYTHIMLSVQWESCCTRCVLSLDYKHPQNLSSSAPASPAAAAVAAAALQTGSSLNVIWAPTAGQAPPQSGHLPQSLPACIE